MALSSPMKLTSSASFSPSIRISLRLKIHQAQAKNFCRVLDIRVLEVVAALIEDGEHILLCQRPEGKARALLWEFPGGKIEPGETKQEALARECREELGVHLHVGAQFMELTHPYPDLTVHLSVLRCTLGGEKPQRLEHRDMRWVTAEEAAKLPLCPADTAIVQRLRQECRQTEHN